MTLDYRTQASLREVLAKLYRKEDDIYTVVDSVGLDSGNIEMEGKARNVWHSVLWEANNQGKVMDIIAYARKQFPNTPSLELAEKDALRAIETPELTESEWHGPQGEGALEKIIGAMSTLRPIGFLLRGYTVSKSVCRVVLADGSTGSGFLVQNNVLVTNHHVLPDKETARAAHAEFNFQKNAMGADEPVARYDFDVDAGYATSPLDQDGGDDWTAVKLKGDPATQWGALPLVELPPDTPKVKDEVIIIQHPGGGQKQIALSHNTIVYADQRRIQYLTDTLEGSSGSPVFDTDWRIVALHHKGGWNVLPDTKRPVFSNTGIHINVVIKGLRDGGML